MALGQCAALVQNRGDERKILAPNLTTVGFRRSRHGTPCHMEYHISAGPYERGQRAEATELRIGVARQTRNFVSRATQGSAQNGT